MHTHRDDEMDVSVSTWGILMRRPTLAALALLATVLGVLTACSGEPEPDVTPAVVAAAPTTSATPRSPDEEYLAAVNSSLSSTLTDTQMLQIGQAVCTFVPLMTRQELVQTIGNESARGNLEAAAIIVDTARRTMCPYAAYATAAPTTPSAAPAPEVSASVANAMDSARNYLDYTGFSRQGLIDQLEYEGYTSDEATEAVDNLDVDYNAEAVESARSYLDYTSFSRSGLIDQLEYEGYTSEQAEHGVSQTYDQ